eukprot:TRINITY_DN609_c0_g1_i1.p1 TRINITY_DN609_c0_g1~~TRINITY_DN609_c0_g1_i1.p1  ORF type:complete len:189 (+),score=30.82 TRINITY_DN609_c0_g1_i1:119-685(+)
MSLSKGSSLDNFWKWYQKNLKENPVLTKTVTSAISSTLAAIVAQKYVEGRPLDFARTVRLGLFGATIAPLIHQWYLALDRAFHGRKGRDVVITKILMDQLLFAPLINIFFFIYMGFVSGSFSQILPSIKSGTIPSMLANWKFWPFVQLINFAFVPMHLRSLVGNIAAFFWNIYITVIRQRAAMKVIKK